MRCNKKGANLIIPPTFMKSLNWSLINTLVLFYHFKGLHHKLAGHTDVVAAIHPNTALGNVHNFSHCDYDGGSSFVQEWDEPTGTAECGVAISIYN